MKKIYRVYDIYCTGDSFLHTESKELADQFCEKLNMKLGHSHKVEEIKLDVPHWDEDKDCMPEEVKPEVCEHTYKYRDSYANCDYYHCTKCHHIHSERT